MKKVRVKTGSRNYDVIIGHGLLPRCGELLSDLFSPGEAAVITNPTIKGRHGDLLQRGLQEAGFAPHFLSIPDGERHKTLESAGSLYTALAEARVSRTTPLIAFGGGVVGDLAGFVAATYKRGLPLVQIPTTLLAQVDSSIGGKTAVDHAGIKNTIGAFHQPALVMADIDVLQTLPATEITNGLAEVIKYAVIDDARLFCYIEQNIDTILKRDAKAMKHIVMRSAAIKAKIVSKDEKDRGLRNILNFGHTIGHGIESASDFKCSHGQAVARGMLASGKIAVQMGVFSSKSLARLQEVIKAAGLLAELEIPPVPLMMKAIEQDKKIINGRLRFILPRALGQAFISEEVDMQMIKEALERVDD